MTGTETHISVTEGVTDSVTEWEPLTPVERIVHAEMLKSRARKKQRETQAKMRKEPTPEEKARSATKSRLTGMARELVESAQTIETAHGDGCGFGTFYASLYGVELKSWTHRKYRPPMPERIERVRRDALNGCQLSIAFLEEWEQIFLLCDHMRHEKPKHDFNKEKAARERPQSLIDLIERTEGYRAQRLSEQREHLTRLYGEAVE